MRRTPLEDKIATLAAPVLEGNGFDLVCVNVSGEGAARTIQIMAENPQTGRIGVDDCAALSRELSALFDVEDPVDGHYNLEVSSPGIDRPLVRPADFERYTGCEAKIEMQIPLDGQKRFRGVLDGLNAEGDVALTTDQGQVSLAFSDIAKARLVLSDELIRKSADGVFYR